MDKKRILIIDDEENFAKLVKLNLQATGRYEVKMENKGASGLAAAKEFKPDLILLDIMMPDLGGDEVAYRIKADVSTKDIPVIFVSALVKKDEVASHDGMIYDHPFIAKPVTAQELIDAIERNIHE